MVKKITNFPSPNFNDRGGSSIHQIILHYTDMASAEEALARLVDPAAKVSAHYLIDKSGHIFQLVDDDKRAWHAGLSFWAGAEDVNSTSLGIELDNRGHLLGPEAFPDAQIDSLLVLLGTLVAKHNIDPRQIWGHSDIAPLRKSDPGEFFPWKRLALNGFGYWPPEPVIIGPVLETMELQQFLQEIGYDCPLSGQLDASTQAVIIAFQRHFTPHDISGENLQHLSSWVRSVRDTVQWPQGRQQGRSPQH